MLRLSLFLLFPCFLCSQHNEKDSLFTRISKTKFLAHSDSLYLKYKADSATNKIPNYSVEAAKVIYFNISDEKNIHKIKEDLQNKVDIALIIKKYGLVDDEEYIYTYVFKPLLIKEYYNKICFQSLVRITRNDLIFDNTIEDAKEIVNGTYFINQDDKDDLEVIYFTEAYQPHQLPQLFCDALHFYQTLTGSSEPIYYDGYRLRQEPKNKDLRLLDSLLEKYPRKPKRPEYPVLKDSLALINYQKEEAIYTNKYKLWDSLRYSNFEKQTTKNKAAAEALKNYSNFLKKYPVAEQGAVNALLYQRVHVNKHLMFYYFRHHRHASRLFELQFEDHGDSALTHHNYPLFARTFFYLNTDRAPDAHLEIKTFKKQFYKDLSKIYLGQLMQTLLRSPGIFHRQAHATDYCLEESELLNSIKQLKTYLETKPKDEVMMFYACLVYEVMVAEIDKPNDAHIEHEEWLEKYLEEFPLVKFWMEG